MTTAKQAWPPDPATRNLLEQIRAAGIPPMNELEPQAARQAMLDGRVNDIDPPSVASITDGAIPDSIMTNAPAGEDHFFMVPKVVE